MWAQIVVITRFYFLTLLAIQGKYMPLKLVPVTFKRLTQTLVNEKVFANVVPNNCALGDQKGEAVL